MDNMKQIDLKTVQIYLISLDTDMYRRSRVVAWCKELGFIEPVIVPGIANDPYYVGLAEAYYNALMMGLDSNKPFIIMEDDSMPMRLDNDYIVDIPENTDALYLGANVDGYNPENIDIHIEGGASVSIFSNSPLIFKFDNVLSAHAILYLNARYAALAALECWKSFNTHPRPIDLSFAFELQQKNNVYFIKNFFYQQDDKKDFAVHSTKNFNPFNHI